MIASVYSYSNYAFWYDRINVEMQRAVSRIRSLYGVGRAYVMDQINSNPMAYHNVTIVALLYLTTKAYFSAREKYRNAFVVIAYPIVHEVFRVIFQTVIKAIQAIWDRCTSQSLTKERMEYNKKFRVLCTAAVIGILPIILVADNRLEKIVRCALSLFSGYTFGCLGEKTNSIAYPILLHMGRNLSILSLPASPIPALFLLMSYDIVGFCLTSHM